MGRNSFVSLVRRTPPLSPPLLSPSSPRNGLIPPPPRPALPTVKRQKDLVVSLKNLSTLLIITYQIIVDLSRIHEFRGGEAYPEIFRKFVYVLELIIGLDMVSFGWKIEREYW